MTHSPSRGSGAIGRAGLNELRDRKSPVLRRCSIRSSIMIEPSHEPEESELISTDAGGETERKRREKWPPIGTAVGKRCRREEGGRRWRGVAGVRRKEEDG